MSGHTSLDREALLNLELIPRLKPRVRSQSKLDSLAWSAGLAFVAYGVRVGIRANRAETLEQCLNYLPVGWRPSRSPVVERLYSVICGESRAEGDASSYLYQDNQLLYRYADRHDLFERLESELALHVADTTHSRVFVHAGVVGWGGRAILIPGKSFAGKTMLVAKLIRAGATYYSDEFAVLDSRGMVHPYARPLQVREHGSRKQTKHPVEALGGTAGRIALPVGLVILSRYKPGAKWRPRHISAGQALLGILDNTVSARRGPAVAFKTLKQVVTHSFAVKGTRGEAHEVVDWISTYFQPQRMFSLPSD